MFVIKWEYWRENGSRRTFAMHCTIWHYLCNLKNVKNVHGGVLLWVKLQAFSCNFTKSNTHPWVFFIFGLRKWYQIAQNIIFEYWTFLLNKTKIIFQQIGQNFYTLAAMSGNAQMTFSAIIYDEIVLKEQKY